MTCLSTWSDIATIATAAVTGGAAIYYFYLRRSKVTRLEAYLRDEKKTARAGDHGQRSMIHLMANCGMSEADILDAAFRSKRIAMPVVVDQTSGLASQVLFEYDPDKLSN